MWRFVIYQDRRGEYRWRLLASNGIQVAASGEGYASRANARRAAETVRMNAGRAAIEEA